MWFPLNGRANLNLERWIYVDPCIFFAESQRPIWPLGLLHCATAMCYYEVANHST